MVKIGGFFTIPLSHTDYALLKRVSGIMGTAVVVYLTVAAGMSTALVVLGLCLLLSLGLYKVNGPPQSPNQGSDLDLVSGSAGDDEWHGLSCYSCMPVYQAQDLPVRGLAVLDDSNPGRNKKDGARADVKLRGLLESVQ
jgi:hypothetical protein